MHNLGFDAAGGGTVLIILILQRCQVISASCLCFELPQRVVVFWFLF